MKKKKALAWSLSLLLWAAQGLGWASALAGGGASPMPAPTPAPAASGASLTQTGRLAAGVSARAWTPPVVQVPAWQPTSYSAPLPGRNLPTYVPPSSITPHWTPPVITVPTAVVGQAAEAQPWPDTGPVYRAQDFVIAGASLSIRLLQVSQTRAAYVKIYTLEGALAAGLFIGGSATASVDLPGGTYTLRLGTGETWYGTEGAFGRAGRYATLLFDGGATVVTLEPNYAYTLTVNPTEDVEQGDAVGSESVSWEDF